MNALPRSTPEAEGVGSDALLQWVRRIESLEYVHSFIVARHGKVIAEAWRTPYRLDVPHRLYSTSKSFVSVAVGIAVSEGRLSLDDRIAAFFPEKRQTSISEPMKRVTVRHLLMMGSGHAQCPVDAFMTRPEAQGDWVQAFLDSPLTHEPGTRFAYNSGGTYMLSAILRRVTGENVKEYLKPRLFDPLGITDLKWDDCPMGTNIGGWGFHLKTEDLAKFAQLLLQKGAWEGRQLVPADYLAEATAAQIDNSMNSQPDWKLGYGYQFWRSQHNCFRGDGWSGQYALVMPDQDMIMAMTSGLSDMQQVLTALWDTLLPAVRDKALPDDADAQRTLRDSLAEWRMPVATGDLLRRGEDGAYRLDANPLGFRSLAVRFGQDNCALTFEGQHGPETLTAGFGFNAESFVRWTDVEASRVAASAAWRDARTLEVLAVWYETPFLTRYLCTFGNGTVTVEEDAKLKFKEKKWPLLVGRA